MWDTCSVCTGFAAYAGWLFGWPNGGCCFELYGHDFEWLRFRLYRRVCRGSASQDRGRSILLWGPPFSKKVAVGGQRPIKTHRKNTAGWRARQKATSKNHQDPSIAANTMITLMLLTVYEQRGRRAVRVGSRRARAIRSLGVCNSCLVLLRIFTRGGLYY